MYPLLGAILIGLISVVAGIAYEWNEIVFFAMIGWVIGLLEKRIDWLEKAHDRIVSETFER